MRELMVHAQITNTTSAAQIMFYPCPLGPGPQVLMSDKNVLVQPILVINLKNMKLTEEKKSGPWWPQI